VDQAQSLRSKA